MGEYKVYCYMPPSGKRYIGQTKTSLAQRAGQEGKNKVWERRKALDKSTRKSLIGGGARNNKSTEA